MAMYFLGIDIGSTTSKCIIFNEKNEIAASSLLPKGIGTDGPEGAVCEVLRKADLQREEITAAAVTGYGRNTYKGADFQASELLCHTLGARSVFPEVRTIIDIGGQDAKVISVGENGTMSGFLMNDKCAAGTGRFLDVMAAVLQIQTGEMEQKAAKAEYPAKISSTCTVFAESEVISQLANGVPVPEVVAGICDSVANRVAALAKRLGVTPPVCMSGGVAQNAGVRFALEDALGEKIEYSSMAQLFGALGAAVFAAKKIKT